MELTIKEIRERKVECEKKIRDAIIEFKDETGLIISDLEVDKINSIRGPELFNITLVVNL